MSNSRTVIVIGAGAAGFFAAIQCATVSPDCQVIILEKTTKVLSKVKVSGGGRCNVTHACFDIKKLLSFYPRGGKFLRPVFKVFSPTQTVEWFESRGVPLKTEADNRIFPVSDSSQSIIDCLEQEAKRLGVQVRLQSAVIDIQKAENQDFIIQTPTQQYVCQKVILAAGGHPQPQHYQIAAALGHKIVEPMPSLFTFNTPNSPFLELAGVSTPESKVKISGVDMEQTQPLLITHWGFSGPAVLKLSAWAARELATRNYRFDFQIHWLPKYNQEQLLQILQTKKQSNPQQQVSSHSVEGLPLRLWKSLCEQAGIEPAQRWADLPKKNLNKLLDMLTRTVLKAEGKTTFKEEFVTAGGISAEEIDWNTMESRVCKGLYFAGEVIDIDGVTGGFNFQAAWATGFVAGTNVAQTLA